MLGAGGDHPEIGPEHAQHAFRIEPVRFSASTPGHARSATSIRHNELVLPAKLKRDKRIWATLACLPDADRDGTICGLTKTR